MNIKAILLWIIGGVAIALLSALYSQDMTVGLGATITGYGLPPALARKGGRHLSGESHHLFAVWVGIIPDSRHRNLDHNRGNNLPSV